MSKNQLYLELNINLPVSSGKPETYSEEDGGFQWGLEMRTHLHARFLVNAWS